MLDGNRPNFRPNSSPRLCSGPGFIADRIRVVHKAVLFAFEHPQGVETRTERQSVTAAAVEPFRPPSLV